MDLEPMNIFMYMIRALPTILAIVLIIYFFGVFKTETKSEDMERMSIEIAENVMASLENINSDPNVATYSFTDGKHIFDPRGLDYFSSNSIEFFKNLHTCSYDYYIEIEDLKDKKSWKFGYKPSGDIQFLVSSSFDNVGEDYSNYEIEKVERYFPAGIKIVDESKPSNYYETVDPAKLTVTLYDTWLTRFSCLVERSYALKSVQEIKIPCISIDVKEEDYDRCIFSVDKKPGNENYFCISREYTVHGSSQRIDDCRYFPSEIKFDKTNFEYSTKSDKKFVAYPIREGAPTVECNDIKTSTSIAEKDDTVEKILLCLEDVSSKS